MFSLRKMIFSDRMRVIMSVVLLVVFIIFSVNYVIGQTNTTYRIYSIIFFAFLIFFYVISESLRYIYRKAIKKLTIECNPEDANHLIDTVKKYDIIKGYRDSVLVFKTLVLTDLGDDQALKDYLNDPVFSTSASLKLIVSYNKLYLALHENNLNAASTHLKEIEEMYSKKNPKRKRARTVYNIDLIHADYYLARKQLTKAEDALKNIDENTFNPREKIYYYLTFAKFYQLKKDQREIVYINKAVDIKENAYPIKRYLGDVDEE